MSRCGELRDMSLRGKEPTPAKHHQAANDNGLGAGTRKPNAPLGAA